MTARELIKGALRLIGAIASGETPSSDEETDALSVLNDILESWANDGLMIYKRTRETFALVGAQQTYTMGTGGDFNTSRPSRITEASILKNNLEIPITIINEQEWAHILIKSSTATIPQRLYVDGSYPLLNVNIWPVPTEVNSLILYSMKPLTAFASAADAVTFPPGYARCLRYNLAGELFAEYGLPVNSVVAGIASESKAEIKRQNIQPIYMQSDAMGLTVKKPFNWLTGE